MMTYEIEQVTPRSGITYCLVEHML